MNSAPTDTNVLFQLDSFCDEFESLFKQGKSPRIADFLHRVEPRNRGRLFCDLVALEISLLGFEKVSVEELLERYASLTPPGIDQETLRVTINKAIATTAGTKEDEASLTATRSWHGRRKITETVLPEIDGFEIESVLGKGGMGVVYRAIQTSLHRTVALKMILDGAAATPDDLQRFEREAQAVAELNDPHFVQIYEFGNAGGKPYMALEFVEGGSLENYRQGAPQPTEFAARTVEVLARAMHKAHTIGLLHRDLKPHNVLLTGDGTPKISDFGLVKRLDPDESLMTRQGAVVGTASYMAPEQTHSANKLTPAADVYALGGILYCLLTGRPPFLAATVHDTILAVRDTEPVPPSRLRPNTPRDLEVICLACLEKDPLKRYATAAEFADDLRRFLEGRPITRRPVSALERAWRWSKRNPLRAAVAGLVVAIAVVSSVMSWRLAVTNNQLEIEKANAVTAQGNETKERIKAQTARILAEKLKKEKTEQYNKVLETFHDVLIVSDSLLRNDPRDVQVRKHLNQKTMEGLESIRDVSELNTLFDRDEAIGTQRLGDIYFATGESKKALERYDRAYAITQNALIEEPLQPVHSRNLAVLCDHQAAALKRLGQTLQAREKYQESLQSRLHWDTKLRAQNKPNDTAIKAIASSHLDLGRISLLLGDPQTALDHLKQAQTWYGKRPPEVVAAELVAVAHRLGEVHHQLGNLAEAERLLTQVQSACIQFQKEQPSQANYQALARSFLVMGDFYLGAKRDVPKAWAKYKPVLAGYEQRLEQDKESAASRSNLANIEYRVGALLLRAQQATITLKGVPHGNDPQTHFERSCALRNELADIDPDDMQAKIEWALALARCGRTKEAEEQAEKLVTTGEANPRLLSQAAATFALCSGTAESEEARTRFRERAFEILDKLITAGWRDRAALRDDPDLDPIRNEPRFQKFLESPPAPTTSATSDRKNPN